ncbi:MAG: hypothetical protein IT238_02945 [Bacteroidia bacterium]|nr:hypothetical protein [Bacteroidia bacterium]
MEINTGSIPVEEAIFNRGYAAHSLPVVGQTGTKTMANTNTSEALFLSKNKAYRTKKGFNKLLEGNPSMDFVIRIVEGTPSLHTPETLTQLLSHYRVMYHLKKIMRLPFAQVQQTIDELLYVYPALSAWGILLILWEFSFTRTPEVFGAFIAANPDEYEAQLLPELCPEYAAWLAA